MDARVCQGIGNIDMELLSSLSLEWTPAIYHSYFWDEKNDIFRHRLSASDGLPPYSQARIIELIARRLWKVRPFAKLWVSVDSPGEWYRRELRRLVKNKIGIMILPAENEFADLDQFEFLDTTLWQGNPGYPRVAQPFRIENANLKTGSPRVLRILARLKTGHTREITSLAGFSETHIRHLLKQLQAENLIEWKRIGKYEGWEIRTKGLRLVHRSWNLPKGAHFTQYRCEFRYAGERHRRVARLWRVWLEAAYPSVEIWESWTEVPLQKGIPDALAWGMHCGRETLFWLEVDSGHSSRKIMERNYRGRIKNAYAHAREWGIPIVFCLMGPPWVVDEFRWCLPRLEPGIAFIGHDWREFGKLPVYVFERWHEDLSQSQCRRENNSSHELSFDPKQYPPKSKKRITKIPKPKSNKPRFSKDLEEDRYRSWGEFEREE